MVDTHQSTPFEWAMMGGLATSGPGARLRQLPSHLHLRARQRYTAGRGLPSTHRDDPWAWHGMAAMHWPACAEGDDLSRRCGKCEV